MSLRLMTCLLLICACLPAAAREAKKSGANGDGGSCPELAALSVEQTPGVRSVKAAPSAVRSRIDKPAARGAGSDDNAVRPPRWHSFLPGMFR